jgi:dephospho-CoA kinase
VAVQVEVDTGFTGALTLPADLIHSLGWPFQINELVVLVDGKSSSMMRYRGLLHWKGEIRIVGVYSSHSNASCGLELLEGHDFWMQVNRGGMVVISDISPDLIPKPQPPGKPLIGLVGGIGSGKSLVSSAFADRGGFVITADAFGHEALQQPKILARIAERWKDRAIDEHGNVDRKKLGAIVFASTVERANLEMLVFPWIENRIRAEIARAQADPKVPFIVLDAAIMLEAGWNKVCSKIVYVHAPRAKRIERLTTLRSWTADDLARRESAQLPLAVKASRADVAVDNSGSAENTRKQVDALLRSWHIL